MAEFLFYQTGRRRDNNECLHDLLVVAEEGLLKTRIMYGANLSWKHTNNLLKSAEDAGLIEEVEAPRGKQHWMKKLTMVWKTTETGRKYVKTVYDSSKLLQENDV